MKLTAKHKAYAGVVAVGLAWLIYDRIHGSGQPDNAVSASIVVSPEERNASPGAAAAAKSAASAEFSSEVALAERLASQVESKPVDFENTRDAFTPPQAWVAAQSRSAPHQADINAEDFIKRHRLVSVLKVGKSGAAQIDG